MEQRKTEINSVVTTFPKHMLSKLDMAQSELELTNLCMSDGHAFNPINKVFTNRYHNMICPVGNNIIGGNPSCFTMDETMSTRCFQGQDNAFGAPSDGSGAGFMMNMYAVCKYSYILDGLSTPSCLAKASLDLPSCPANQHVHKNPLIFNVVVYLLFGLSVAFVVCDVYLQDGTYKYSCGKRSAFAKAPQLAPADTEEEKAGHPPVDALKSFEEEGCTADTIDGNVSYK